MTTSEKLSSLACELAGEAWDYDRRRLSAQAYVRQEAAEAVTKQAERIQREDAIFEDPATPQDRPDRLTCANCMGIRRATCEPLGGPTQTPNSDHGDDSLLGLSGPRKASAVSTTTAVEASVAVPSTDWPGSAPGATITLRLQFNV